MGLLPARTPALFDLILATKAHGVILLSGNVHFAEISQVETKAYPLLDFTSSGLTQINEAYAKADNDYRVAGPLTDLNFGLVEIDWSTSPSARITLKAIARDGSTGFTHRVKLDTLK